MPGKKKNALLLPRPGKGASSSAFLHVPLHPLLRARRNSRGDSTAGAARRAYAAAASEPSTFDPSPPALRCAQTKTLPIIMGSVVYFDMTIGGAPAGRIEMTLRTDIVPKTAEVPPSWLPTAITRPFAHPSDSPFFPSPHHPRATPPRAGSP